MIDHQRKIVFIHIPKTYGVSTGILFGWPIDLANLSVSLHYDTELTEDICKNYFMFTFVRNPFERCLSLYYFWKKYAKFSFDFNFFCRHPDLVFQFAVYGKGWSTREECHLWTQSCLNNNREMWKYVDFIGRCETYENDIKYLLDKFDVNCPEILPHENKAFSELEKHYSEFYNEKSKSIVSNRYTEDLERFNYSFSEVKK